jgi:hypothetical protein
MIDPLFLVFTLLMNYIKSQRPDLLQRENPKGGQYEKFAAKL